MAEYADREHFIPLRRDELVDMLCADEGLAREDREAFRQFCRQVVATYHFEYNQHLERLKAAYAPFDPDSDCVALTRWRAEERQHRMNDLFTQFAWLMDRANFKHLSREEIEPALGTSTEWGLVMDVDFGIFERLAVFVRGDGSDTRSHRLLSGMYRKEEVQAPAGAQGEDRPGLPANLQEHPQARHLHVAARRPHAHAATRQGQDRHAVR